MYEASERKPLPNPDLDRIIAEAAADSRIIRRSVSDDEILARCLYTLVNEGARIIDEKIAQRSSDLDVVWIHGYGFPRHRGGPMFWAGEVGLGKILAKIEEFGRTHDFWEPAPPAPAARAFRSEFQRALIGYMPQRRPAVWTGASPIFDERVIEHGDGHGAARHVERRHIGTDE